MKKLAFLTVLFVLALALVGCNAENDEPQGDNGGISEGNGDGFPDENGENEAPGADEGHNHSLTYVYPKAATCTEDGIVEHWRCTECGKAFSNPSRGTEIAQTVIPAKHTFSADWSYDGEHHWRESTCGHDEVTGYGEHKFYIDKCTVCHLPSAAETDGMIYSLNPDGASYTLTGSGGIPNTVIIIPAYYNGLPVTAIGDDAFYGQGIRSVVIPDTVVTIGDRAFSLCTSLSSITFGTSLKSIGAFAFSSCGIGELILPEGLCVIGDNAFAESSVTSIVIPDSVTDIGASAFRTCRSLESVVLGKSLTEIKADTFHQCESLKSISVPSSIKRICASAFDHVSGVEALYIEDISAWCTIDFESATASPTHGLKALYVNGLAVTDLVIPQGTEYISSYAFYGCASISSLTVSDGVTKIGEDAFMKNTALKKIVIADSVTSIGGGAFYECKKISTATLPYSFTLYGGTGRLANIFKEDFIELEKITLTSGTEIAQYAFYGFAYLNTVVLPDSITAIGKGAFEDCSSLGNINLPKNLESIGAWAFSNCGALYSITISESVRSIGNNAFDGCHNLTNVIFAHSAWYCTANPAAGDDKIYLDTAISTAQNATYLTDTYRNYYWVKVE